MVAVSLKKIFFKQKTAYEITDCDWSSDVCSSDLERMVKQNAVSSCLSILSELSDTLVACIRPVGTILEFSGQVNPIVKRHRILTEMDSEALAQYDDMSLDDVDYVVLQS